MIRESLSDYELSATIRKLEAELNEQMMDLDHSDSIQKIIAAEQSFWAELKAINQQLIEAISNLDNPDSISEERRKALLTSHQKWGTLGWTWFPIETLDFYDEPPADANDAYERVVVSRIMRKKVCKFLN